MLPASSPNIPISDQLPELTSAGLNATVSVTALNEQGEAIDSAIAVERALTVYLDKREVVTLMTLGNHPELLILGWLRNQQLITDITQVKAVQIDWEVEAAVITTRHGIDNIESRLSKKTVTTGCGQGTMFGDLMANIESIQLKQPALRQSDIYLTS